MNLKDYKLMNWQKNKTIKILNIKVIRILANNLCLRKAIITRFIHKIVDKMDVIKYKNMNQMWQ